MRIFSLFILSTLAYAQTAKYPGAIATDADLLKAKDRSASTLTSNIDASTLSIPVADGTHFTAYETITIDNEQMMVCSVSGNTLTICTGTRGFDWTDPATHNSGAAVRGQITAWHHNAVSAEVKAIENHLGTAKTQGSVIFAGSGGAYSQDNTNFFWDNTNKRLGIGTTSPDHKLVVNGNIQTTSSNLGILLDEQNRPLITRGGDGFTSGNYNGAGRWGLFMEPLTLVIGTPAIANNGYVLFARYAPDSTINQTTMTIDPNGNVGIGSLAPAAKLHVYQSSDSNLGGIGITNVANNKSTFLWMDSTDKFHMDNSTSGSRSIVFNGSGTGNVGIGTTSPTISGTGRLHVSGNTVRPFDTARTPANSSEACNAGELAFDASYVYVCVASNTWKRASLTTW